MIDGDRKDDWKKRSMANRFFLASLVLLLLEAFSLMACHSSLGMTFCRNPFVFSFSEASAPRGTSR